MEHPSSPYPTASKTTGYIQKYTPGEGLCFTLWLSDLELSGRGLIDSVAANVNVRQIQVTWKVEARGPSLSPISQSMFPPCFLLAVRSLFSFLVTLPHVLR